MNLLDVRTVVFSHLATDIVCALVIAYLWHQNRRRFAGTSFWVVDFSFQATATLLIILRGSIPDWMSMVLANTLVIAGALSGYMGLERFVGKTSSHVYNYILLATFALVHSYFTFVQPNLEVRNLNLSLGLLILCFQCTWLMLRRVHPSMRQMTRGVGLVFGVFCLVSLVRIVVLLAGPPPGNDFFQSGTFDTLILMAYQILLILFAYSLILMVNGRLLMAVQIQEEKFAKAFRSSPYAIMLTRLSDGQILEVNDGFVGISGYSVAEAIGRTSLDLHLWSREEDRTAVVDELSKSNKVLGREVEFRKKSGEILTGLFSAEIISLNDQPWILSSINDITERKQAEETLKESEARFRTLVANLPGIVYRSEPVSPWRVLFISAETEVISGFGVEDFSDGSIQTYSEIILPDDLEAVDLALNTSVADRKPYSIEYRLRHADGSIRWVYEKGRAVYSEAGEPLWLDGVIFDITERKRLEMVQNAKYRITQTLITSENIDDLYHSIHSILGELIPVENFFIALYDSVNELISFPYYIDQYDEPPPAPIQIQGLTGYVIRTGRPLLATREIFDQLVQQGEVEAVGTVGVDWLGVPLKVRRRKIGVIAVQSYTQGIHFNQEDINLLEFVSTQVAQAIDRKRLEEEIRSLSLTDELTGLYNRRGFTLLAEQEMKLARRIKRPMLLFYGDVDDLKRINDTLGHAYGDLALKEVSGILKESFREADILARFGGDEFVVLMLDVSKESAEIMTNRIQAALKARNQQKDKAYHLSLSLGIASYDPENPCTLSELIAQADGLMYHQKQTGRGKL